MIRIHPPSARSGAGTATTGKVFFAALSCMIFAAATFWGPAVRADSILLRGGERLVGKIEAENLDTITFASHNLGVLEISRIRIERIERDAPPPPPSVAATAAAPAPVKDSIVPAPPPGPAEKKDKSSVAATPPAVSPAPLPTPTTDETAMVKTVEELSIPAKPEENPISPLAPKSAPTVSAAPIFYPWSGLLTEQDTYDWIQLKSGEWLKGKIKSMQDEKLEFDSEEIDYREFDWEDIHIVRSPRLNSVRFEQNGTGDGSLLITKEEVQVISAASTKTYPRSDLLAITPTGNRERNKWSGNVSAGLNLRSGNTEETSYNINFSLQRRTPATRLSFDYLGNYSNINGSTTEENQRVLTQFDYFLSRKLYLRVPDAEYYRDRLQNIEDRITLGASVGYDLYRTRRIEWDVAAGPAYQGTKFTSVESGADDFEETVTLVLSTHVDVELTNKIDWILDYRGQLTGSKSSGGNTQHASSTVEFEIHKRLKFDLSLIWDRVGSPKTAEGGTTPTTDDFRLTSSLGIDF